MSNPIGVGLVGAGVIGSVHAEALRGVPNAKLLVVAEPREDAGKALAENYGIEWTPAYADLLQRDDVDLVILGTPSGMHPEQAILAAKHGKHVITEKPMAITAEGASAMIAAAEEAGVHLAVIFQNRLSPDIFRVRRAIEAGALGKLVLGQGYVHWHRTQEYYDANGGWRGTWALDGGGALMNQSIHTVDLLQYLIGGVTAVQAFTATLTHDIETEDTAAAALAFNGGALGTIGVTTSTDKDRPVHIEIVGDRGKAVFDNNQLVSWESELALTDDLLTPQDKELVQGWVANEGFGISHRRQQQAIFNALERGEVPPFTGREARKAVDIILGIYESARTGRRVELA